MQAMAQQQGLKNQVFWVFWLASLAACASISSPDTKNSDVTSSVSTATPVGATLLPAAVLPWFGACSPGPVSVLMQLYKDNSYYGRYGVDLDALPSGGWEMTVNEIIGAPLVHATWQRLEVVQGGKITVDGSIAHRLPLLDINQSGFLSVDGQSVLLKPTELPCLFEGQLPTAWLVHLTKVILATNERVQAQIVEEERKMTVDFQFSNTKSMQSACAAVESTGWWAWWKPKWQWCVRTGDGSQANFTGTARDAIGRRTELRSGSNSDGIVVKVESDDP